MVKRALRLFAIHLIGLLAVTYLLPGFHIEGTTQVWLVAALTLSVLKIFIHPVLRVMLLPINVFTSQTVLWIIHLITLYALVALIPQITIRASNIPAYDLLVITSPQLYLTPFLTALVCAVLLSMLTQILNWFLN